MNAQPAPRDPSIAPTKALPQITIGCHACDIHMGIRDERPSGPGVKKAMISLCDNGVKKAIISPDDNGVNKAIISPYDNGVKKAIISSYDNGPKRSK